MTAEWFLIDFPAAVLIAVAADCLVRALPVRQVLRSKGEEDTARDEGDTPIPLERGNTYSGHNQDGSNA